MKKNNLFYIVVVLALLLFPLVGMPLFGSDWSKETTELAPAPELKTEEGKLNTAYLADAGTWFEDHFALRSDMITANSLLQANVFGTSANRKITVGSDGWLYFNGDMDDYQTQNRMSDRELHNIAHNLSVIQQYYTLLGKKVIFTVAPNKTTLYPEHLPANVLQGEETGNLERLLPYLEELQIPYVDLFALFRDADETLYFKEDSHWNNQGAALVYNALMEAAGCTGYETYEDAAPASDLPHSGDLAEMIYPERVIPEMDYSYPTEGSWSYTENSDLQEEEENINMSSYIQTENPEGSGNLYMFRDSFGASMVPFFASAFEKATFSWLLPYNLTDAVVQGADTVIIECVERNIDYIAEYAASLPALDTGMGEFYPVIGEEDILADVDVQMNGGYIEITGSLTGTDFADDTDLVIRITGEDGTLIGAYVPFYISESEEGGKRLSDNGFRLDLMGEAFTGSVQIEVLAGNQESMTVAAELVKNLDELTETE